MDEWEMIDLITTIFGALSYEETGAVLGISSTFVEQIERKALRRARIELNRPARGPHSQPLQLSPQLMLALGAA